MAKKKKETPGRGYDASGNDERLDVVHTQTTRVARPMSKRPHRRTILPSHTVGNYTILEELGSGGNGTVYMAERLSHGDKVAVKVLHEHLARSERQVQRFEREVEAIQMIHHPAIVEIYDRGTLDDGRPYFVMELIQGQSLAQLVAEQGRVSPVEALAVLTPICEALSQAHERGVVHRDIKASNVMLEGTLDRPKIKLLDFGIAKLMNSEPGDSANTSVGLMLGSPYSMAPEQIVQSAVDARTDIYSLGILAYFLLTGEYPFKGSEAKDIAEQHMQAAPPRPSRLAPLAPGVDDVIMRAMEKRPEHRYANVKAFLAAFGHAVGAANPGQEFQAQAVAIYMEARVDGAAEESDALQHDLVGILEMVEETLSDAGFQLALDTSNAVLGVKALSAGAAPERARALEVARTLYDALAKRPHADPGIHINLVLHCAGARARKGAAGLEIAGGPIVDVGSWAPQHNLAALSATPQVLGILPQSGEERPRYLPVDEDRSRIDE